MEGQLQNKFFDFFGYKIYIDEMRKWRKYQ